MSLTSERRSRRPGPASHRRVPPQLVHLVKWLQDASFNAETSGYVSIRTSLVRVLTLAICLVVLAAASTTWLLWRKSIQRSDPSMVVPPADDESNASFELPSSGLLVSEEVLRSAESGALSVWDALERATIPIAVEYFPVSEAEVARYRTVPINSAAQQSITHIVQAVNPNQPTLYRAVLPKGAELVRAVGTSGFRGFSRTGGRTAHAVLKPVAAGGAVAAGWPIFAVAGTVMAIDMVAQRELRAHQRQVVALLARLDERHYVERVKDQRTADAQLTRAISLILDGHTPGLDHALKSAYDEFHRAQQFIEKYERAIQELVGPDGKVDYRELEKLIGKEGEDLDFFFHLRMARGAVAIRRKALLADAASATFADPDNPYTALRKLLDAQSRELEEAERATLDISARLAEVQLKGGWSIAKAAKKQDRIRELASPPDAQGALELLFLRTADGDVVQVVPEADDIPTSDEDA